MFRGFSYQQNLSIECYLKSDKFKKAIEQNQPYDITALVSLNIDLSLLLLVEALQKNNAKCQNLFNTMHFFSAQLETTKEINWLWGRYFAAANILQDIQHIKIANTHLKQLSQSTASEYNAWAWGYFLIYANHTHYNANKEKTFEIVNSLKNADKVWGFILLAKAAATHQDEPLFRKIISNVGPHIKDLPLEDYKAWALTELRLSAIIIGDAPLSYALEKPQKDAQTEVNFNTYIKHQDIYKKDQMVTFALNALLLQTLNLCNQPRSRL